MDAEDYGIHYFHSAYCSIHLQPLMAYVSKPKLFAAIQAYRYQYSCEENG
jgi:hypothetical protein